MNVMSYIFVDSENVNYEDLKNVGLKKGHRKAIIVVARERIEE